MQLLYDGGQIRPPLHRADKAVLAPVHMKNGLQGWIDQIGKMRRAVAHENEGKAVLRRVLRFEDVRKAAQLPGAGEQRQAERQTRKEGFAFLCAGAQVVIFDPI